MECEKIYLPVGKMFNCQNKGEMKPSLQVKIKRNKKLKLMLLILLLLTRALETTQYLLAESDQEWIPVHVGA